VIYELSFELSCNLRGYFILQKASHQAKILDNSSD